MAHKHNILTVALLAVMAMVVTPVLAQEKTPNDPRLFTPGKLTVSTSEPSYPPWVLDNNPEAGEGFEAALVYALAAELGFKKEDVVWVDVTFDGAIAPGPKAYDFSIQQISVTPERAKVATFSDVYYQSDKAVIALPTSTVASAKSFADLKAARWGVAVGTTDFDYVTHVLGIDNAAVYDDQAGVFQALQGGQIDATVAALPTALYATCCQVPEAKITAILPKDPKDEGLGLLFAYENPIVPWINEGLAALKSKGVIDELAKKYLIADPSIPEITQ
ncbi:MULTISPECIES: ABC transporter substrate-binding protein [unclassified Devosia]|jgi:polar amino acid transport system substrate-binding protein|uniref:ABC transporter substrate-binding protein n=1 Tax=unclassified Devosia TaxID=196773 RepID=UPI00095DE6DF|nr:MULTISPECIES: ABC transporter substrate-binding protein [unclassified Devosia]MBN9364828.1 amino acid ABC transporter substrate-binding protein [Devosia sp.]OJX25672.1 MAG: amino acid ABC transporter substrate-binding protein [Devosia sp. 66-14]